MTNNNTTESEFHEPVLVTEVLHTLAPAHDASIFLDGTVGGAGHLIAYATRYPDVRIYGIDADGEALKRAEARVIEEGITATLTKENFRNLDRALENFSLTKVDRILLDLGWGAHHLVSGRGFSFQAHEPLLMTYEDTAEKVLTAYDLVNRLSESELADIIYYYGEERFARRIAAAIVEARRDSEIKFSDDLAAIVAAAVPRKGKINPATRTFQALRIAVNDELDALREGMRKAVAALSTGGRLGVISFHSIEDRIVKNYFKELQEQEVVTVVTKKPLTASEEESHINKRARSAKLRVIEKIQ